MEITEKPIGIKNQPLQTISTTSLAYTHKREFVFHGEKDCGSNSNIVIIEISQ